MTTEEFSVNDINYHLFEERNFYFWVKCGIDALDLLGPETDGHLENIKRLLLDYYGSVDVSPEVVERIPSEIVRLRGVGFWRDDSPIGLKYRCLYNLAHSREENLADLYNWQYGVESSFDLINLANHKDREQAPDALIQENASKYGVVLY